MGKAYTESMADLTAEWFKDPEFRKEYDLLEPEFQTFKEILRLRKLKKMSQRALAKKIFTKQSAISRFERGMANPTISFLARVADALGKKLVIEFR
jgi:ribosome-binding protein aMBF1 (putative translation factor)